MTEQRTLTVTELNDIIKQLLDSEPLLSGVYVRGELSNYKVYPSGHHYFTLKDAGGAIRCVMFKSSASKLRFRPESGMGVTVFGRVSVYTRDGAYQIYCTELMPEGMGDLYVAYEQLRAKLQAEGLFDQTHKKPIPRFPERIAVITSSAGAAVHDIIRVLGKRWPLAKVVLLPVRVQGAEAPPEIVGAIRYANRYKVGDLIIAGRGGGSIEDLWAFNDERVARAIYDSELPVISAVGHEPDVTIADYVADLRAATPSNAAELAVPDIEEWRDMLAGAEIRCAQAMRKKLGELRAKFSDLSSRRALSDPSYYIDSRRIEIDHMRDMLTAAAERSMSSCRQQYVRLAASLDALSPLKVLGRGYAVASAGDGSVIRDAHNVQVGEHIDLRLSRGSLNCRVEEINGGTEDGK